MSSVSFTTEIGADGKIAMPEQILLAPGKVEVTVVPLVDDAASPQRSRTSLAKWAEEVAEPWGDQFRSSDVASFTGRRF